MYVTVKLEPEIDSVPVQVRVPFVRVPVMYAVFTV